MSPPLRRKTQTRRRTSTRTTPPNTPPHLTPLLDRVAVEQLLTLNNITISTKLLDGFYTDLHKLFYPSVEDIVGMYRKYSKSKGGPRLTNLPSQFLSFLASSNVTTLSTNIHSQTHSANSNTVKLIIQLHDGHKVECVIMKHEGRNTICVSSQVGCAMGCTFCATGTMGIRGNLSAGEILEQLVHAERVLNQGSSLKTIQEIKARNKIRNIVFMGMGEPLNNYSNVSTVCKTLINPRIWGLGHGRVTVSTVGITSKMRALSKDLPQLSLALSLHAPFQDMREKIVPAAKHYPIEDLIQALDEHLHAGDDRHSKRVMIEYVMLDGDTSSLECAHELGRLCRGKQLFINLIPYNQTDVQDKLTCPPMEYIRKFQDIVSSYGTHCFVRKTMGADIAGACGQLVKEEEKREESKNVDDLEDYGKARNTNVGKSESTIRKVGRKPNLHKNDEAKETDEEEIPSFITSRKDQTKVIKALAIATGVAASCFIVSSAMVLRNGHNSKR